MCCSLCQIVCGVSGRMLVKGSVIRFFFFVDPWLLRSKSPVGNPQLIQFSREVIDLLKSQPSCVIPVSKFIPTYHHHFAKQCRVSDYGYSKLMELLEAVPHVLQVSYMALFLLAWGIVLVSSTIRITGWYCVIAAMQLPRPP